MNGGIGWLDRINDEAKSAGEARRRESEPCRHQNHGTHASGWDIHGNPSPNIGQRWCYDCGATAVLQDDYWVWTP